MRISNNDISAETIINHQYHIVNNNNIRFVQYYSLQGSYFMNRYLRSNNVNDPRNLILEQNIKMIWSLIKSVPTFKKSHFEYW